MPSYDSLDGLHQHRPFYKVTNAQADYKKKPFWIVLLILAIILILGLSLGLALRKPNDLAKRVELEKISVHLQSLEDIATEFGGSRTAQSGGYNASVEYVTSILDQYKDTFDYKLQYFDVLWFDIIQNPTLVMTSPNNQTFKYLKDFQNMRYAGSGDVTGQVSSAGTGCTAAAFENFTAGHVAIIDRGTGQLECPILTKYQNALTAGASAVLFYWTGNGLFSGGLTAETTVPCFALGSWAESWVEVADLGNLQVHLTAQNSITSLPTMNVIAATKEGNTSRQIIVGAHLDSVPAGPGINDNGSGSSALLALAELVATVRLSIKNQIVFAWWAAEELGLLGSTFYVNSLTAEEKKLVALNLNYDMIGSPNYFTGVYDGAGAAEGIRTASQVIMNLHTAYLDEAGLPWNLTDFDGRSDYGPFIANGIPAGGLFSGAEVTKSMADRSLYGGLADAAYDPCYHQACDTFENIDNTSLVLCTQTAGSVLQTLAEQEDLPAFLSNQSVAFKART